MSVVFFHNPNYDAAVECIPSCRDERTPAKYDVDAAGDYLKGKFIAAQTNAGAYAGLRLEGFLPDSNGRDYAISKYSQSAKVCRLPAGPRSLRQVPISRSCRRSCVA